jgi:competence protein ComEC
MRRLKIVLQYRYLLLIVLVLVILLSLIRVNIFETNEDNINSFTGILISKKIDGDKLTLVLKNNKTLYGIYYLKDESELDILNNLELGTSISINGTLMEVSNNTIPNTFNYKKYLKHNMINYYMKVSNYSINNKNINILYKIKNYLIKYINSFKSKNYLSTFIIGNKEYLDDGVYNQYQNLGVSHIFAISGMHVSLLSLVLLTIFKFISIDKRYLLVIIFLCFYIFLTNYQASVLRSIILFIILYLNKRLDFNLSTIQCLYLTLIVILLFIPSMIYNVGFLYSSIVSYSLIKYSFLIKGNYVMKCLKISLIALLYSLPITINLNYQVNICSVINNLLFVPLVSFIIYPLSLLTLIFKCLDGVLFTLTSFVEKISLFLPIYNIVIPKLNIFTIIIYYILLELFFKSYNKLFLLIIIIMIFGIKISILFDNNYYVYYLDVGQGDSIVIKYKNKCIMIDTGGKTNTTSEEWRLKSTYYYTDNTIKFLHSIGISKINYLILSHGDYDHMGESIHLVNNIKVDKVIFNISDYDNLETNLIRELDNKNIKYYNGLNNIAIANINLLFLNTSIYDNENDNSNVIYTKINNRTFLFMGDASINREEDILNTYNLTNIDFLKVGHHGSKTSTSASFINVIKPEYSIISVGKNNTYGHPTEEVLEILANSNIYRTDKLGTIEIILSNHKYYIKTFSP